MGQAGFLEHDETVIGIRNFAREVYPRLQEAFPGTSVSGFPCTVEAGPPAAHMFGGGTGETMLVNTPLGTVRPAAE
jgi:hypothetical protein